MEEKPLSIFLGPITLDREGPCYIANWYDPQKGNQRHPIDPQWNPWLEKHFSYGPLSGIGFVFVPPEMLKDNPSWRLQVKKVIKDYCNPTQHMLPNTDQN